MKNWIRNTLRRFLGIEIAQAAPAEEKSERMRISMSSLSAMIPDAQKHDSDKSAFRIPEPPPGVLPSGKKAETLAMDAGFNPGQLYTYAMSGIWGEGLMFMGYPYLAELTQRPEYRRISEIIALEMTRKWIRLTSRGDDDKTDKIKALEAAMERFGVQKLFREMAELDGFFGRSHLFIDVGTSTDQEIATQLVISATKIGKGSLKKFQRIEPIWTYPNAYNADNPLRDDYFRPTSWFVQGKLIHASRLLTFVGRPVPDLLKPAYSFGGLSLSQIAKPYIDNWLRTRQSVSDLLHSFSVLILKTDLQEILNGGAATEMLNRAQLFIQARDNRGLMMIDKEREEAEQIAVPLSSLPELQAQSQEHMAAVTGIPIVKLLGIQPAGLNASSEGEIVSFEDWIAAKQEQLFRDHLTAALNVLQLNEFGEIDPEIGFVFEPLRQLDAEQDANRRKVEADTDAIYLDRQVITPEEARKRLATEEDSPYTGIDVEDVPPPANPENEASPFEGEKEDKDHAGRVTEDRKAA